MDLWVRDGVEQPTLVLTSEDELAQLLPVDLPVLQQDLRAKVLHYPAIGWTVGLHHCQRQDTVTTHEPAMCANKDRVLMVSET